MHKKIEENNMYEIKRRIWKNIFTKEIWLERADKP
jgi:hypothetical protein